QLVEVLLLERLELARGELELLRHLADRQAARLARLAQRRADAEGGVSQTAPSAAPGTRASPGTGVAAGWRSSARRRARPACARRAARGTAIRRSAPSACCSASPGGAPRRGCPACSGSAPAAASRWARRDPS